LEAAIHKMTLKAAERFRIPDRGLCQAGKFADINVIDPNQLAYMEGKNVSPSGWKYILINGRLVFIDGEVNDETIENSGRFIPIP
jgi:N-acyl-D-amino-acid deacylase